MASGVLADVTDGILAGKTDCMQAGAVDGILDFVTD